MLLVSNSGADQRMSYQVPTSEDIDGTPSASAPTFSPLHDLYLKQSTSSKRPPHSSLLLISPLLAIDPGETTGIAIFDKTTLLQTDQLNTSTIPLGIQSLHSLIHTLKPRLIVMEDYHIYSWRTKQHTWSSLHTPRLIGVIECLSYQYQTPLIKQSAQQGKGFVTDQRLKEWGLYQAGQPHARDAIRHACQCLLFGDLPCR